MGVFLQNQVMWHDAGVQNKQTNKPQHELLK